MIPTPSDRISEGMASVRNQPTPSEQHHAFDALVEDYLEGVATEQLDLSSQAALARDLIRLKREYVA